MPTTDATLTTFSVQAATPARRRADTDRLVGLFLMAALPALFWTGLIALTAPLVGFAPSYMTLALIAGGIGAFLASVCCALTAQPR